MKQEKYQLSKNEISHLAFWANLNGTTLQEEIDDFFAPKKELSMESTFKETETFEEFFKEERFQYWNKNRDIHQNNRFDQINKEEDILNYSMLRELED